MPRNADAIARAIPRSAAGSFVRRPPATEAYTSCAPRCMPARRSSTARIIAKPRPVDVGREPLRRTVTRSRPRAPGSRRAPAAIRRCSRRRTTRSDGSRRAATPEKELARDSLTSCKPRSVHHEDADLVGAAETVFVRAHDAILRAVLALEVQDRIDEVLEQSRPRDRTVFRDVTDDEGRAIGTLRELHQRGRAIAYLRDASRERFHAGQRHRLNGIDDERARTDAFERVEDRTQIRFGEEE